MFLFSVAVWSTLQLIWTIVLLVSQLVQIARQMTTLEVSNLGRYGYMGARGSSLATQMGHRHHSHSLQANAEDAEIRRWRAHTRTAMATDTALGAIPTS